MTMIQMFANLTAGEDIFPARLLKMEVTVPFSAHQTDNVLDISIGVSGVDTRDATDADGSPSFTLTDSRHAIAGEQVRNQEGHVLLIESGAAFTAGLQLVANASGQVIGTALAGDYVVGIALDAATAAGELVKVKWQPYFRHA